MKRRMAVKKRTTVCQIFQNGWSSSQIILRKQRRWYAHVAGLRFGIDYESGVRIKEARHFSYFSKNEIAKSVCETKALHRRRIGEAAHRAKKSSDLRQVITNSVKREVNHGRIIDALWCKILLKILRKVIRVVAETMSYRHRCEKLSWNQTTSALHRSETNGIVERAAIVAVRIRRKMVGLILRNVIVICGTSKTSWRMENSLRTKIRIQIHLEHWSSVIRFRQQINPDFTIVVRNF